MHASSWILFYLSWKRQDTEEIVGGGGEHLQYYISSMSKTVTVLAAKFSDFTVFDFSSDDLSPRVVLRRDSERRTET